MASLYDRFGRIVWSVIRAIVHDDAIAEDLVQETFLRVWNRIHLFEAGKGALGPWMLAIARNRAIDHIRSAAARMDKNVYELDVREHPSLFVDRERDVLNADHARLIRNALLAAQRKSEESDRARLLRRHVANRDGGKARRAARHRKDLGSHRTAAPARRTFAEG